MGTYLRGAICALFAGLLIGVTLQPALAGKGRLAVVVPVPMLRSVALQMPVPQPPQRPLYRTSLSFGLAAVGEGEAARAGGVRRACFHCLLERKARKHGVPFRLARAVVQVESNYNAQALGMVGEIGLMQVRPQTARWLGFAGEPEALYQPRINLEYGVRYLARAWELADGDLCRAILKYNAGHNARRMNKTSQRYCDKVQAILRDDQGRIRSAGL